jgi:hypothetical protein
VVSKDKTVPELLRVIDLEVDHGGARYTIQHRSVFFAVSCRRGRRARRCGGAVGWRSAAVGQRKLTVSTEPAGQDRGAALAGQ